MATPGKKILEASAKHPKPAKVKYQYGTAGFRMKANLLGPVFFRVALAAALRSRKLNGQTIGIMITASHNPPEDNGVKLVDPMGEMLEASWESYTTELANAQTDEDLLYIYEKLRTTLAIKPEAEANIIFARDSRESGPALVSSLVDGLKAVGATYVNNDILTTPQLHYLVRCINTKHTQYEYGEPTEDGYYKKLAAAYKRVMKGRKSTGTVTVDCANGVGGVKLAKLIAHLPRPVDGGVEIKIVNADTGNPAKLNYQCGADFVKTQQRPPPSSKAGQLARCASLDGDADRIVYYFIDSDKSFRLLDGDKIATLTASFIGDLAKSAGLADKLKIGVVQTAYANGSSTAYITKSLNLPVVCTPTGVKHLHHAAVKFDIGVYFEANGHGTVVFSSAAFKTLESHEPQSPAQALAMDCLLALTELINQAVGDALSDLLLVEVILAHKTWGPKEWDSTYTDIPNRLVRVEVPDRNRFKAVDAERRLEEPKGVQELIDALVSKYKQGRSFARASGTEDAVRVYAEAATRGEADDLASKVASVVQKGGQ
ncbi:MAG: Phosphoacetylglucosamine Mutase [Geoglossum simile]|nr:MAG: Phosphoacetylglucosamine Mutase [Geoglossum simile]